MVLRRLSISNMERTSNINSPARAQGRDKQKSPERLPDRQAQKTRMLADWLMCGFFLENKANKQTEVNNEISNSIPQRSGKN